MRAIIIPLRAVLRHAARQKWCDYPDFETAGKPEGRTEYVLPDQAERLIVAAAEAFTAVRPGERRVFAHEVADGADPSQTGANTEFNQAPANPLNRFVMVASAHLGTPDAAREAVLAWLHEPK